MQEFDFLNLDLGKVFIAGLSWNLPGRRSSSKGQEVGLSVVDTRGQWRSENKLDKVLNF